MSLTIVQIFFILIELKERASFLLTISFKRSNAILNAINGVIVEVEAMASSMKVSSGVNSILVSKEGLH